MLDDLPYGMKIKYWRSFIFEGLKEEERFREIRNYTSRNLPLGGESFVEDLEFKSGRKLRLRKTGRPRKVKD